MMKRHLKYMTGMLLSLALCSPALAGGDAAAGEALAPGCAGCHEADGSGNDANPPLTGIAEADFVAMLNAYKSGEREHAMMQMFVASLSEQDMADLAAYYASIGQ